MLYKMNYRKILNFMINNFPDFLTIKKNYFVIALENTEHHITIFKDQWDNYKFFMKKPYHLFHISSNNKENRCSSYFWVTISSLKILKIPKDEFLYNQPIYNFTCSTRSPCSQKNIIYLLRLFQHVLNLSKKLNK